jgi:predicted secreted Zn-dependent protease
VFKSDRYGGYDGSSINNKAICRKCAHIITKEIKAVVSRLRPINRGDDGIEVNPGDFLAQLITSNHYFLRLSLPNTL